MEGNERFRTSIVVAVAFCLTGAIAVAQQPIQSPYNPQPCLPTRPRAFCPPSARDVPGPDCSPPALASPMPTPTAPAEPLERSPAGDEGARGAALGSGFGALADVITDFGYIDSAVPKNLFRVRYDYGFDMNRPDRAEYFYAAWREISFHPHGILGQPGQFQGNVGRGLDPLPGRVDFQELSGYLELAANGRASAFVEVPFRILRLSNLFLDQSKDNFATDPEPRPPDQHEALEQSQTNAGGLSDVVLGFKWAVLRDSDRYFTFQFRTFFPSGDARNGAGTGHFSVEPGLLYSRRLAERWTVQSQFKVWLPIDGTRDITTGKSFAGNILIYGAGLGYDLVERHTFRLTPIAEFVGWTVLNGFESLFGTGFNQFGPLPENHGVGDVTGQTIINAKLGVRAYFGAKDDVYVGFGQALTDARWYNEIIRVEYRRSW